MSSASSPVLLLHDGDELADVAALLRSLGIPFDERQGAAASAPLLLPRDLLVATGRRGLSLPPPPVRTGETRGPARVAVVGSDSPNFRSGLREAGFELLVRRPVHPTALRLLLLRLLYRGPERRRQPRVAVGTTTRYRLALIWRRAILTELSTAGCRLLTPRTVRAGWKVLLEVPDPDSPAMPVRVSGRVVRSNALGPTEPTVTLALEFVKVSDPVRERLERIVELHGRGPASLPGGWDLEEPLPEKLPAEALAWEPEVEAPLATPSGAERRRHPRARYSARVVTLGEEAAHIVMGRDLSVGGMRIEPHGGLERGQRVALALHGGSLAVPVVVRGCIQRDDGADGLVIRFEGLGVAQQEALEKLTAELGGIERLGSGEAAESNVVTRILPSSDTVAVV